MQFDLNNYNRIQKLNAKKSDIQSTKKQNMTSDKYDTKYDI